MADITATQAQIDREAAQLLVKVERLVKEKPERRAKIFANSVWGGRTGGLEGWAIRTAAASVDHDTGRLTPRRRLADRVLRRPAPTVPTVAQHEARAFQRRLDMLRARGIELIQDNHGRWLRRQQGSTPGKRALVPVETPRELLQIRVARGEIRAKESARLYAKRLGVPGPPRRADKKFRWSDLDQRVQDHWRNAVARETARVAHDALLDTWRDAAFDRMEDAGEFWVRQVQPNACGACLALADGQPHPASDRVFYRHTRCRCIPVVYRAGRTPTGREIFDSLSEQEQDDLFRHRGGRAKAQALRDGQIGLSDLVLINRDRVGQTDYVLGETAAKDLPLRPPGAG